MSKEQLVQLFKTAHSRHVAKLELLADLERSNPTTDRAKLLTMELARGEAYALLADRGGGAQLDHVAEGALRGKGYDTDFIIQMLGELESLRDGDRVRMSLDKETGTTATAANIARSSPVYRCRCAEPPRHGSDRSLPQSLGPCRSRLRPPGLRLRSLTTAPASRNAQVPAVPLLSQIPLTNAVRTWSEEMLEELAAVKAGALDPSSLIYEHNRHGTAKIRLTAVHNFQQFR